MHPTQIPAAISAGVSILSSRGLAVEEAGCPVAALDPRVEPLAYRRSGFAISLWTYYRPLATELSPSVYAHALERLHAGMRAIDFPTPHFTDRVHSAVEIVTDRECSPDLVDADRALLGDTLGRWRRVSADRGREQLLHGEPHPGHVLNTRQGPVFIDLETCCRGAIEFDLAHAPEAVSDHYPGVDPDLLRDCRILMLAMVTAWRSDREDQLPDGRRLGMEGLEPLRELRDRGPQ